MTALNQQEIFMSENLQLIAQVDERIAQARSVIQHMTDHAPGLTALEIKRILQIATELLPTDRYQTPSAFGTRLQQ